VPPYLIRAQLLQLVSVARIGSQQVAHSASVEDCVPASTIATVRATVPKQGKQVAPLSPWGNSHTLHVFIVLISPRQLLSRVCPAPGAFLGESTLCMLLNYRSHPSVSRPISFCQYQCSWLDLRASRCD